MSAPVSVNNNNKADIERQIDRALIGAEQELEELVKQKEQYLNDFEAKKTDIIRNLAKYLESLGEEKNRIASRIAKYFAGKDYISKSHIYDVLGIEYKNLERSTQTREGIALSKSEEAEQVATTSSPDVLKQPIEVGADGHSYPSTGIPSVGPIGNNNVRPQDKLRIDPALKSVGNELISRSTPHEDKVEVPADIWQRFIAIWSKTEIL